MCDIAHNLSVASSTISRIVDRFDRTGAVARGHHDHILHEHTEYLVVGWILESPYTFMSYSGCSATVHQASTSTSKEQAVNIAGNHVRCCGDSKAICAGKVLGPNPGKVGVKNPGCTALLFVAMREPLPDNIAFMDHLEALPGAAGVEERLEL